MESVGRAEGQVRKHPDTEALVESHRLIAEVIADHVYKDEMPAEDLREWLALDFADRLAETNPNFDRQGFIDMATLKLEAL